MKIFLFLLGLCVLAESFPQVYEAKGYKVYRIQNVGRVPNGADLLQGLASNGGYDFWTDISRNHATDILVPENKIPEFESFMKANSFSYSVLIEDVGKLILEEKLINKPGVNMDWDNYHRYDTIKNFVESSALANSGIASIEEIGRSIENRPLIVVKIGKPVPNKVKPAIFMDGGIHAREWISPALTSYFINEILNNSTYYDDILSSVDLYILPVANPDGYEFSHTSTRLWRKNRRPDATCAGIDLNRNFGFHWGGIGSSGNKCEQIYRGTAAFSEPESAAMRDFIEKKQREGVNWRAYYAIHSYAQMWLLPWGWTYEFPEDYDELKAFGNNGLAALTPVHGTRYEIGTITEILSPGAGASDDWAKGSEIFKYVQTIEVRDTGRYGFILPPNQIKPCAEETWAAILANAKFLANE